MITLTSFLALSAEEVTGLVVAKGLANPTLTVTFGLDDELVKRTWRRFDAGCSLARFDETALAAGPMSLYEHVARQIPLLVRDRAMLPVADTWLEGLEPSGWVSVGVEDVAATCKVTTSRAEQVLLLLQGAEPAGLFARSLRECLTLQLRDQEGLTESMARLLENLPLLASGDLRALAGRTGIAPEDLPGLIGKLRGLNPKPGSQFLAGPVILPAPDFLLEKDENRGWELKRGSWLRPVLKVTSQAGKEMAAALRSATAFTSMFESRDRLIFETARQAVATQGEFLDGATPYPRPLSLGDLARSLNVHETTIGRIRKHVIISDGHHALRLRELFIPRAASINGVAISSKELVGRIFRIRSDYKHEASLTDDGIRSLLRKEGIDVSRRTISKYRMLA